MSGNRIPKELAALLAAALTGGAMIEAIAIPDGATEEDIEKLIEAKRAEHRETCAGCRAEYEAEMAAKARDAQMRANASSTTSGEATPLPTRQPIGYVVWADKQGTMAPVPGGFHVDRSVLEEKLARFEEMVNQSSIGILAQILGTGVKQEIRPVFGD